MVFFKWTYDVLVQLYSLTRIKFVFKTTSLYLNIHFNCRNLILNQYCLPSYFYNYKDHIYKLQYMVNLFLYMNSDNYIDFYHTHNWLTLGHNLEQGISGKYRHVFTICPTYHPKSVNARHTGLFPCVCFQIQHVWWACSTT